MKKTLITLIATVALFAFKPAADTWTVDNAHSKLGFTITHMMVSDVEGAFKNFTATVTSSKDDFTDAVVDLNLQEVAHAGPRCDGRARAIDERVVQSGGREQGAVVVVALDAVAILVESVKDVQADEDGVRVEEVLQMNDLRYADGYRQFLDAEIDRLAHESSQKSPVIRMQRAQKV